MLRRSTVCFVGVCVVSFTGALLAQQAGGLSASSHVRPSKLDTVIESPLTVTLPISTCMLPSMTWFIAKTIGVPAGVESLPSEPCRDLEPSNQPEALRERLTFTGMTVREAFTRLVALDPRYHWIETDGVAVMRPLTAWTDPQHFLHRTVPSSHVDAGNVHAALTAVYALWIRPLGGTLPGATPQAQQPVSFDIKASAYETLNSVVRAHGALIWRVNYCSAPPRPEFASVYFDTFDGGGSGMVAEGPPDSKGRRIPKCGDLKSRLNADR